MLGLIFEFSIALTHRAPPNRKHVEAPGQLLHVSECVDSTGWWEQRTRQCLERQQPRSSHPDRDCQGGAKIKRSQDYFPLATSHNCGTAGPHARPCILVETETFCPLSSAAIITPVSQHFLTKPPAHNKKIMWFSAFFLFLCMNQPRIVSYRLLRESISSLFIPFAEDSLLGGCLLGLQMYAFSHPDAGRLTASKPRKEGRHYWNFLV